MAGTYICGNLPGSGSHWLTGAGSYGAYAYHDKHSHFEQRPRAVSIEALRLLHLLSAEQPLKAWTSTASLERGRLRARAWLGGIGVAAPQPEA